MPSGTAMPPLKNVLGNLQTGFTIVGVGLSVALLATHLGKLFGLWITHLAHSSGFFVICAGLLHAYLTHSGDGSPYCCPREYFKRPKLTRGKLRLVCLGDSITAGTASSDYCGIVRADLAKKSNETADVVNAGVNGHCAWNMLQRVDDVVRCDPTHVFVLAGTNDVKGAYNESWGATSVTTHSLPEAPSIGGFERDLGTLLTSLKMRTGAKVAVATLPPMGEHLDSGANSMVTTANAIVERLAEEAGCQVLPLHSKLLEHLEACPPAKKPLQAFEDWPTNSKLAVAQAYLLGRSWDCCGARLGMRVMSDGLHLNDVGGKIVAALVGDWLANGSEK